MRIIVITCWPAQAHSCQEPQMRRHLYQQRIHEPDLVQQVRMVQMRRDVAIAPWRKPSDRARFIRLCAARTLHRASALS
jgi:hypothetical protein